MFRTEESRDPATTSDDLYGAMLAAVRAWMERHHPDAEYTSVVSHLRDGVPDVQIPVTLPAAVS